MTRLCRLLLVATLLFAQTSLADEDSPEKKLKTADGLFKSGSLPEAEQILITIAEPSARALQLLGQVQVRQKKYEVALKTYERYVAVEKIPSKRAAGETLLTELKTLAKTRFKIVTTPPGATVFVDSKVDGPKGTTPISQQVTPGRHKLILELAGFETIKVDIQAVDQQELELPFVLIPRGCELTVTSQPERAKVFIDGKSAGVTPVGRSLRAGTYRVEAILQPGEPPVVRQVLCDDKDQKPMQVNFAPGSASDSAPQATPAKAETQPTLAAAPKELPSAQKDAPSSQKDVAAQQKVAPAQQKDAQKDAPQKAP